VLLRLAYLTVTNAFAMLRLLPMSDRDKDAEILALRPDQDAAAATRP
jgi:putative transposase